jgi:predicted RNase H-like HicB family nuclease
MINTKENLQYTIVVQKAEEGGYIAFAPFLPGCMSQGDTFEEVEKNIREAISGYIAVLKEDGEEIPMENQDKIAATVSVPMPA